MKKIYKKLTKEQRERGVIFTSSLSESTSEGGVIHEVLANDDDRNETIARLKNDKFFNRSHWKYNVIRT